MRSRAAKKLEDDETMLYEHALRCFCKLCGGLLNWDCPKDISYTETECCGLRYRLQPWTVKVRIEDISSRPVLPQMEGSNYSDPEFRFSDEQIVGNFKIIEEQVSGPLSEAQNALSKPFPAPSKQIAEPRVIVIPAKGYEPPVGPPQVPQPPQIPLPMPTKKVRKCGLCRKPGHTRRKCPELES
jgi:hypothetical protein